MGLGSVRFDVFSSLNCRKQHNETKIWNGNLIGITDIKTKPNTKAEARVARSNIKTKQAQIRAVVKLYQENNTRSYAALKTGLFPLIKSRSTIDSRLDGKVVTGSEKQYCSILTNQEKESIVRFVKNKNCCLQGINKSELTTLILDIINIRDYANKKYKGGRGFCKLSANAKRAL